ncbi:hypothetical protein [Thiorhodovibrio litoralis]|uniref:hypothetical protein n=1 Tax=Thiorhodovibrio litoralis TaxID=2952932 RepID=UPI002B26001C|nr:hypothetical protein [Thiorhodovibrio litoralis]WPL14144.1 hypothetical protein Thiosp_03977 [Thiorhodovibrio litoralis]
MNAESAEHLYLAEQLTALERCAYFALLVDGKVTWPLTVAALREHRLDGDWFEPLAALNERFAKLQDVLGSVMRHTAFMLAEPAPTFLSVLVFFEKHRVITSVAQWHRVRKMRNQAAHDYDLQPAVTAAHFNQIHAELPELVQIAARLVSFCQQWLDCRPLDTELHEVLERALRA